MTAPLDLDAARQRAIRRRAAGVAVDFDPARLTLARRLSARQRTQLARQVGVTPAAITQYEKGQSKPTLPVLAAFAEALAVPVEFFRAGHQVPALSAGGAHFRSLRSTSALEREKALAFGEVALSVFAAVEQQVDLPAPRLPELPVSPELDSAEIVDLAGHARARMGVARGPVPHVVRLLEAHGVAVVRLDDASHRVDAFSHLHGPRPLVMLNPAKYDKARSRFDAAHELGHLLMHHDTEPGSRLAEMQAHAFAAEFLAPAAQIADDLPTRPDWVTLHALKRRWGLSLKALVMRAHTLERLTEHSYRRALRQLSVWGLPEPGPLGAPEVPVLLPRAIELLGGERALGVVARDAGLPVSEVRRVWLAAGADDPRPTVDLHE